MCVLSFPSQVQESLCRSFNFESKIIHFGMINFGSSVTQVRHRSAKNASSYKISCISLSTFRIS
uniref:Uncharacterized protein n=1 Tax=Picea glauca TaxID=3330 RepID=A0A124GP76_PICGL|nr:hypothetical protein ABT39_MTgene942 [Picea glauca]QHR90975.1 hypothetical protein Q903MT_gene5004 [Picea sitchensis]